MSDNHRSDGDAPGPDQPETPPGEAGAAARADATFDIEADRGSTATETVQRRRGLPLSWLGRLALAAIVIAAGAATFFWWQNRELERTAAEADVTAAALETLRADLDRAETRAASLASELTAALDAERRARETLAARVDAVPARLADLDRRLGAVQGAPFEARTDWLRAQAEYYLAVAGTELALAGRWQGALTALDLADQLLAELADSTLAPVREAIAAERQALTSVRLPDIEGLAFNLAELGARAAELPLRAELPANYTATSAEPADEPAGMGRLLATVKAALVGLVRVERRQTPVAPELTAAERLLARRQLELELTLARVAAVDRRPALLEGALDRSLEILRRDFDTAAPATAGAIELLETLRTVDVDPPRPTLGRALNLLRGIAAGGR